MIRAVTVTNQAGESLEMDLFRPYNSGMNITNIDGIGPGKATINSTELYGLDGASFNSSRFPSRQIVFKINFVEAPDIETVRHRAYRYFPLRQEVKLTFKTDAHSLYIRGIVSGNEPDIFQKNESVTITVDCFDPYFYGVQEPGAEFFSFSTSSGGFEFPFSNLSGSSTIDFSNLTNLTQATLVYDGDVPTGCEVFFTAAYGAVTDPTITNLVTNDWFTVKTSNMNGNTGSNAMNNGDIVRVDTRAGKKTIDYITPTRSYSTLRAVSRGSTWLTLQPGENTFRYSAASGAANLSVQIRYAIKYMGI